jgi:hypothetical protein
MYPQHYEFHDEAYFEGVGEINHQVWSRVYLHYFIDKTWFYIEKNRR